MELNYLLHCDLNHHSFVLLNDHKMDLNYFAMYQTQQPMMEKFLDSQDHLQMYLQLCLLVVTKKPYHLRHYYYIQEIHQHQN